MVSAVWGTQDASFIAISMDLEPEIMLCSAVSSGNPSSAEEASALLWIYFLWASRSLIATTTFLSQATPPPLNQSIQVVSSSFSLPKLPRLPPSLQAAPPHNVLPHYK